MSAPPVTDASASSRTRFWHFTVLGVLTILIWIVLLAPATDSFGLHYAYLLETDDSAKFLQSDHLLWHLLNWSAWLVGRQFAPEFSGLLAQQTVNLLLFLACLLALWFYIRRINISYWLPAIGLLASYASLKALVGGDVAAGPLLMMVLVLFILPGSQKAPKLLPTILILALAPLFHKSLFLLVAGWWLAESILGHDPLVKRVTKSTLVALSSVLISLAAYFLTWFVLISSQKTFSAWLFLYGSETQGFLNFNLVIIVRGLLVAFYRTFLPVTPFKAFALGDIWGLAGIILSGLAFTLILIILFGIILINVKKRIKIPQNTRIILPILVISIPSLLFFLFWIPGYYTYWTRFLPFFWLLAAFHLPQVPFWNWAKGIALGLLILVNYPSQYSVKGGEEAGRLCRWLSPWLTPGDLVIMPGNGVLFFGTMPRYYYGVDVITLDALEKQDEPAGRLRAKGAEVRQQGHKVWLLLDYAEWTSERLIQGEQARFDKGMVAVEQAFMLGPKAEFIDPAMKEAWIAECLPRQ